MNKYLNYFLLTPLLVPSLLIAQQIDVEIEEILVSASLLPITINRSANAITIIDRNQLKNRAVTSVSDLLRDVAGLAVSRSGVQGSQTQIRIRGSEANHLLVLIDGVEANNPSQSDEFNWGTLVASDIERIEIIRGSQSSMLGSDAMAGVVNIITQSAEQPFGIKTFAEAGSFDTQNNGVSVELKNEDFDMRLGISVALMVQPRVPITAIKTATAADLCCSCVQCVSFQSRARILRFWNFFVAASATAYALRNGCAELRGTL